MEDTLQLLRLAFVLLCPTLRPGLVLSAALTVSPGSSQFLEGDAVSLSCEDGGTVRRDTGRRTTACGEGWGVPAGPSCSINYIFTWDSGRYWCESREDAGGDGANITVYASAVVLQSPLPPVTEGQDVTLTCKASAPSHAPPSFYRDGVLVGSSSSGRLTLRGVSRSDGGEYRCDITGLGASPPSRISVTERLASAPPTEGAPPTDHSHSHCVLRVVCHLVVFCPYFISTALAVSFYRCRAAGNNPPVAMVTPSLVSARQGLADACDDAVAGAAARQQF